MLTHIVNEQTGEIEIFNAQQETVKIINEEGKITEVTLNVAKPFKTNLDALRIDLQDKKTELNHIISRKDFLQAEVDKIIAIISEVEALDIYKDLQ